jgi:hypothetical protein
MKKISVGNTDTDMKEFQVEQHFILKLNFKVSSSADLGGVVLFLTYDRSMYSMSMLTTSFLLCEYELIFGFSVKKLYLPVFKHLDN